jgi:signal transduction histidine kinase
MKLPLTLSSPFRRIYAKIFLWFCATICITAVIFLAVTALTGSQPFGRRWMSLTQDLYAHSAIDFYRTGGTPALKHYLDTIAASSGIQGQLLDSADRDLLGDPILPGTAGILAQSRQSGRSAFQLGRTWSAASPVVDQQTRYTFVMEVHPTRGFLDGTFIIPILPRLALGVALVALFCLLLARNITQPIRVLEDAASQLAAGSLSVRAGPRIGPRKDELGRMALAFDNMAQRIQNLIYSQQEMLGHISHELRSPLTRIGVSLELLRRGDSGSLDQMQLDLDRMNQLIGEILQLTRMDLQTHQPGHAPTPSTVDLSTLLESIVHDAAFESRHLQQRLLFHGTAECIVSGDSDLLRRCCENVVRNALLYTPDDTPIQISLTRHDGRALIVIRDQGPGVPPESIPHLFDLFYRDEAAQQKRPEGTGLGLAIAQRTITLHCGTISAHNISPHGLEVAISLPLASSPSLPGASVTQTGDAPLS